MFDNYNNKLRREIYTTLTQKHKTNTGQALD